MPALVEGVTLVELGGSGGQVVRCGSTVEVVDFDLSEMRAVLGEDQSWALSSPGVVRGGDVLWATNLGWPEHARPSAQLGASEPPRVLLNDAEAAALGEAALNPSLADTAWAYVSLGTGVGSFRSDGDDRHLGHLHGFSDEVCPGCGSLGCLDTMISGRVLPDPLTADDLERLVAVLASALDAWNAPTSVVLGGGLARRYSDRLPAMLRAASGRHIKQSRAPAWLKSASPYGLSAALNNPA